ncbi:MAG: ATPase, T2SS/T4P/T4SS family [Gemmatimonadota bacterium]
MYTTRAPSRHWLDDVADATGLRGLHIDPNPPFHQVRAAWAEIARASSVSDVELAERVATHFRLKVADLSAAEPSAAKLFPEQSARKHGVLPLRASDQVIVVATADPTNVHAEQDLQFLSGRRAVFQIAAPGPLAEAIDHCYSRSRIIEFVLQNLAAEVGRDDVQIVRDQAQGAPADTYSDTRPVASLVKRMLRQATSVGASEVHISGNAEGGRVHFRIGSSLQHFMHLPYPALVRVVRRLKELGRLDLTVRQRSQEGQFTAAVEGRRFVMRVRSEPGRAVESLVVRISDPALRPTFADLGLPPAEVEAARALLSGPPGLVVVAGAPGRGRETLLTAFTRALAAQGPVTVVDSSLLAPVPEVRQIQADPEAGFRFGEALAQALDADPAAVVVSRLDEDDSARLAVEAARQGTWIVAALDAEDPAAAVATLRSLELSTASLAEVLRGIVVFRSLRRLCEHCQKPVDSVDQLPARERVLVAAYGVTPSAMAGGCPSCQESGYSGELLVTHAVQVVDELRAAIGRGASMTELGDLMRDQGSLEEATFERVRAGRTSLLEVERSLPPGMSAVVPTRTRPRVLVVDDSPEVRLLARTILEGRGFDVAEASDGDQALLHLELNDDTSLVLLDLNMPRLGGAEVLARIRGSLRTAGLPVVVLTAEQDPNLEIELMEAGADDYLRKPVEPSRLAVRVRAVLRRAGSYDALLGAPQPELLVAV